VRLEDVVLLVGRRDALRPELAGDLGQRLVTA
jgi:hypothetical protein